MRRDSAHPIHSEMMTSTFSGSSSSSAVHWMTVTTSCSPLALTSVRACSAMFVA